MAAGRWAALLFVAVGAGYIASEARKNNPAASASSRLLVDSEAPAWVSPEETTAAETEALAAEAQTPVESAPPPEPPARRETRELGKAAAPASAPAREPEPEPVEDRAGDTSVAVAAGSVSEEDAGADEAPPPRVSRADVREEAAEALAELDRQRRAQRAAAATAEIDRARRSAAVAPPEPAPAPAPRTLEQRSGIYLRIGLDEAARQLGRPVHVIEGLGAQFMGLVQGRQSAGADASRPVVRVVYQDSQGRMMLLDQQRIRPGQTWPAGATQWTIGEIGLHLHGEVSGEALRSLRPRVR